MSELYIFSQVHQSSIWEINQMRAGCKCHSNNTNKYEGHSSNRYAISRLRSIASSLGINLTEVNICHTNLAELIGIAQRRAHQKPFLWAHLKAVYANVNVIPALSKLVTNGCNSHIGKIITMVNNGASANSIEAYVNELLETQIPRKLEETMIKSSKTNHFSALA